MTPGLVQAPSCSPCGPLVQAPFCSPCSPLVRDPSCKAPLRKATRKAGPPPVAPAAPSSRPVPVTPSSRPLPASRKATHKVTVSTIGCIAGEVNVFDSMPPAPTTDLLNQVAALLCSPQDTVKVKYIDVQMQDGSSDCGLFAIAFATTLANGIQPGRCFFNQGAMRSHLMKCLQEQNMTEFPIKKTRRTELKVKNITGLHVHCMCRMPEIPGSTMIQCSTCKMWYHVDLCVSVPCESLQSTKKWYCKSC